MMLKANQYRTPATPVHLKTMSDLSIVLEKIMVDSPKKSTKDKNAETKGIKHFL